MALKKKLKVNKPGPEVDEAFGGFGQGYLGGAQVGPMTNQAFGQPPFGDGHFTPNTQPKPTPEPSDNGLSPYILGAGAEPGDTRNSMQMLDDDEIIALVTHAMDAIDIVTNNPVLTPQTVLSTVPMVG